MYIAQAIRNFASAWFSSAWIQHFRWIHALENLFCPLIWASYVQQCSHHSMETRLLPLGSLSHRNQVRFSWAAFYCPCHLSKVLIVIWHLSFSDRPESKLDLPLVPTVILSPGSSLMVVVTSPLILSMITRVAWLGSSKASHWDST